MSAVNQLFVQLGIDFFQQLFLFLDGYKRMHEDLLGFACLAWCISRFRRAAVIGIGLSMPAIALARDGCDTAAIVPAPRKRRLPE